MNQQLTQVDYLSMNATNHTLHIKDLVLRNYSKFDLHLLIAINHHFVSEL